MGRICQLVMGPAGSGKSTYCTTMMAHLQASKRSVHLVNLDPAAENFEYKPTIDIRSLITLEDVMEELKFGPNGGLIYCMEYLMNNLDWFEEELSGYEEDYLIIDCPGQIELYTHIPIMRQFTEFMKKHEYVVCGLYLIDSQFIDDTPKFFAGVLSAMSAMLQLEVPHINIMTKMDLLGERGKTLEMDRFYEADSDLLEDSTNPTTKSKFHELNKAIVRVIDEYNMVGFIPLDNSDEDSVALILQHIDHATQFGEDAEPKEIVDEDFQGYDD
ncbi:hypothetical protein SmJEL517_g02301 [Synchytrium microbalum]|uniref:GPN-loop GTPase 3 n=1 Tax=Synchytrium microbalum TaxID=1806994 RepID=A0A507C7V7_9FUNG|nr:uncharacterized protein SmJEL517_g02301 [Synchytrium microbalum]TPX35229.1 hypothetical protein SmJEL517_g02301 [Synchytrium microbalum]